MSVIKRYTGSAWELIGGGGGSIDWTSPISVTTTATLTIGKHHVCSGTLINYTVTLPAVSGNAGKLISVEMSGALTVLVTLDGNGSEVIDGATTRVMWAKETATLLCDGTQWTKIGGKSIPMFCKAAADSSAQQFSSVTFRKILLASEQSDYGSFFSNSTVTIRRTGLYSYSHCIRYNNNNATANTVHSMLYVNGSLVFDTRSIAYYSVNSGMLARSAGAITLNSSDTIELYGYYSGGSFATSVLVSGSNSEQATFIAIMEVLQW